MASSAADGITPFELFQAGRWSDALFLWDETFGADEDPEGVDTSQVDFASNVPPELLDQASCCEPVDNIGCGASGVGARSDSPGH